MAYFPPYVSSAGIHIPTYTDIRNQLVIDAKSIFGQDIYLESDAMDYQFISAIAQKIYDSYQLSVEVYNSRSPSTAVGTGLDAILKVNGIKRQSAVYSTCIVRITGTQGITITNGVVADINSTKWDIPASVTILFAGYIDVIATCQISGPITAAISAISTIVTPTYGWSSVNNAAVATVGSNVESDAALRARQAISTNISSLSILESTKAAIASVTNVTRYKVYENDTDTDTDVTAHSIAAVVEGGTDLAVATAIFDNKSIGCGTDGTTTQNVTDQYGQVTAIKFYRPTEIEIDVVLAVKALTGYVSQTTIDIKQSVADFLNSLDINNSVSISSLWGAALGAMIDLRKPIFSITAVTACVHAGSPGTTDIAIDFNEVAVGDIANITVTVT